LSKGVAMSLFSLGLFSAAGQYRVAEPRRRTFVRYAGEG
jgi:hypothetical protein